MYDITHCVRVLYETAMSLTVGRCLCLPGDHRLTADEIDCQRQQTVAYEYLCRLEEAKRCGSFSGNILSRVVMCYCFYAWVALQLNAHLAACI